MANHYHKNLSLKLVISLLAIVTISCQPKTRKLDLNTTVDTKHGYKLEEFEAVKTCDNQLITANIEKETIANGQTIEEEIANKDIEHVNCQGQIIWKGHGPEKNFRKIIAVETALTETDAKVSYIQIENSRTCTVQRISPADDTVFDGDKKLPTEVPFKTMANSKGNLKLMLTDSIFRNDANAMNILDGDNLIKIQYFGKCLKYREKIEEKYEDAFNCETAELIKTKELYINVKIKRPEVAGTAQVVLCFDGKTK